VENEPFHFWGRAVTAALARVCDSSRPVGAIGNAGQRFKEEMLRAGRYKHALSAILVAVDGSRAIDGESSPGTRVDVLAIIARIITKSIRAVDILARYPGDRFLLILPNTNKREAFALAERLHANIRSRTARIKGLSCGVTARLAVGQVCKEDNSYAFLKSLEHAAETDEGKGHSAVYACQSCR
jgi:diguanylate cyclase (GGDEF)-like protein